MSTLVRMKSWRGERSYLSVFCFHILQKTLTLPLIAATISGHNQCDCWKFVKMSLSESMYHINLMDKQVKAAYLFVPVTRYR